MSGTYRSTTSYPQHYQWSVSDHLDDPVTLPSWKETPVPTEWDAGWISDRSGSFGEKKNLVPLQGN